MQDTWPTERPTWTLRSIQPTGYPRPIIGDLIVEASQPSRDVHSRSATFGLLCFLCDLHDRSINITQYGMLTDWRKAIQSACARLSFQLVSLWSSDHEGDLAVDCRLPDAFNSTRAVSCRGHTSVVASRHTQNRAICTLSLAAGLLLTKKYINSPQH